MNLQFKDKIFVLTAQGIVLETDSLHGNKPKALSNTTFQSASQIDKRPNVKDKLTMLKEKCKKYLESMS